MKAQFETVHHSPDTSWRFFLRELDELPFEWHYHPEYELTLTVNSSGERYVGDHITTYQSGDLVLLGPNLPHSWASRRRDNEHQPHRVYVLWFRQDLMDRLTGSFPEFANWQSLLWQCRRGLAWPAAVARDLEPLFQQLPEATPEQRLIVLLDILRRLHQEQAEPLASAAFDSQTRPGTEQRQLSALLDTLHQQFREPLTTEMLARQHFMSVSTLNRFFRRQMNQSPHQYLTQVRLGHACSQLISTDRPVAVIAETSGFGNLSNFNRHFRLHKGMTPRAFRASFQTRKPPPGFSSKLASALADDLTVR